MLHVCYFIFVVGLFYIVTFYIPSPGQWHQYYTLSKNKIIYIIKNQVSSSSAPGHIQSDGETQTDLETNLKIQVPKHAVTTTSETSSASTPSAPEVDSEAANIILLAAAQLAPSSTKTASESESATFSAEGTTTHGGFDRPFQQKDFNFPVKRFGKEDFTCVFKTALFEEWLQLLLPVLQQ